VQLYSSAGGSARWRGGSLTKGAAVIVIVLQLLLLQQTQHDWKSNLDLGKSAIRIQPNQGAGYVWVGDAVLLTSDCSPSLPWYRRSVEVDPSYTPGYFKFIACLAQRGQNNEALNAVIALEIRQSSSSTLSPVKASLLMRLGRNKEAHEVVDQGLKERPGHKQLLNLKQALIRRALQPTDTNQAAP
jgi:tetratricopeptide (TPR) repeat protein